MTGTRGMPVAKVAFMFLTVGDLNHGDLWRAFFDQGHPALYRIVCHPKYPDRIPHSSILKANIIDKLIHTSWAHNSLVEATILMIRKALEDPLVEKFVLLSDSCIPVDIFDNVYKAVVLQEASSFSYNPDYHTTIDHSARFKRLNNSRLRIPPQRFMKAHQWFILDRRAASVCANGEFLRDFDRVFASDEHYFINICAHYKIPFLNIRRTFVDFEFERSHPRTFHEVSQSLIMRLRRHGYLFMRKIGKPLLFIP